MDNWQSRLRKLTKGNDEYAKFNKAIVNTKKEVLGVRMPDLRKLAKELAKRTKTLNDFKQLLTAIDAHIYEEVLLFGLVISYSKLCQKEKILLTRKYLDIVDSWAEIDSFIDTRPEYQTQLYWDFTLENLRSTREFHVRYGVILLMSNFLVKEKINEVFKELRAIKCDAYYVKMGCAWLYATAAVDFYKKTLDELSSGKIDSWTRNKALQKMLESRRFSDSQKEEIRDIKKIVL